MNMYLLISPAQKQIQYKLNVNSEYDTNLQ